jgi:hypothetical protein
MLIEVEGALLGLKSSRIFRHCNFFLAPRRANFFIYTAKRCFFERATRKQNLHKNFHIYIDAQMLPRFTEKWK